MTLQKILKIRALLIQIFMDLHMKKKFDCKTVTFGGLEPNN